MKFIQAQTIFFVYICSNFCFCQENPCPEIFSYNDQNENGGFIDVATIGINLKAPINLNVKFLYKGEHKWQNAGKIFILNDGNLESKINYGINFPKPHPIIYIISINGRKICENKKLKGIGKVTVFESDHLFEVDTFKLDPNKNKPQYTIYSEFEVTSKATTDVKPISQLLNEKSCGVIAAVGFLYNAKEGKRGQSPWLVPIYSIGEEGPEFVCSANLIGSSVLITSASCLMDEDGQKRETNTLSTFAGKHDIEEVDEGWNQNVDVQAIIQHPNFSTKNGIIENDIGLIFLKSKVNYTKYVKPICIWTEINTSWIGEKGKIAGWGRTETGKLSSTLKFIEQKIVSQDECSKQDRRLLLLVNDNNFCAGGQGQGICEGDTGNGFVIERNGRNYLNGIASVNLQTDKFACDPNKFNVYTNVQKYLPWIENELKKFN